MLWVPFPKAFEFRSPRKDLPWRQPVQQVATVEFFDPLHECIELRSAMARKRQASSLDFQHMLIPRLDPAAIDHVALDLGGLCDQRRKASPVADSKNEEPPRPQPPIGCRRAS